MSEEVEVSDGTNKRQLDAVVARLRGAHRNGCARSYMAMCPIHEAEGLHTPSLKVWEDEAGNVAWHCFAGCGHNEVGGALGLVGDDVSDDHWTPHGPAVAEYRYVDEEGRHLFTVCRTADKQFPCWRPDRDSKTGKKWNLDGVRRVLYRLPDVVWAVDHDQPVWIAEGEKDVEALRELGVTATCNPGGAGKWHPEYGECLVSGDVVIIADRDAPGRAHAAKVADALDGVARSVRVMEAAVGKDAADHIAAHKTIDQFVPVEKDPATSIPAGFSATVQPEPFAAEPPAIAYSPDVLAEFVNALHSCGVAGEDRFAQVTYLSLTSRVLERPVSLAAKGPSSAGKSFVVQEVVGFFPADAVYALSAMSEHALAYSTEPLGHRFLILYEAAGLDSDFASYLLRSLLSEGRIRYETVEKKRGEGMVPRLIEREGPTGLIVTTTAVSLHPENETRLLSVPANDTPEQTKSIMRMLAREGSQGVGVDRGEWRAFQTWIAAQDNRVTIPFAVLLAELVPPVAVRLRRDFATVRDLIKAHAILHQATRRRDQQGCIVATIADYAAVRELIADLVADEVDATVSATVSETVAAVVALQEDREAGVTYKLLGERLGLDKSTAKRRADEAVSRGYIKNLETRRGLPAKLVPGDPLPGEVHVLPKAETLRGCMVADEEREIGMSRTPGTTEDRTAGSRSVGSLGDDCGSDSVLASTGSSWTIPEGGEVLS